eukprot:jgi/Mesvir1/18302/Mv18457-RA.1
MESSSNDCGLSLFESLPRELIQKIFERSYPDGYALSKTLQPHFDVVKAKKVEAAEVKSKELRVMDLVLDVSKELAVRQDEDFDDDDLNPMFAERSDEQLRGVVQAACVDRIEECEDAAYTPRGRKEEKLWSQWEELEYGIRNIMGLRVFRRTRQRIEERLYDVLSKNLPFGERISCFANKVYNQIARQEQMAGRKTEGPGWDYGFGWWRAAADAHWANFRNTEVLKP